MQNLLNHFKNLFLKFKLFIWKIMNNTVSFQTFGGSVVTFELEEISTIIMGIGEVIEFDITGNPTKYQEIIQVVTKLGKVHHFPAIPNKAMAMKVLASIPKVTP